MEDIQSTLVENAKAKLVKTIPASKIRKRYKRFLGVDTKRFFNNIDYIKLFECEASGFQFFYPFNVAGDGKFYEDLSKNDWYYMPWKWENEETKKLLKPEHKLLEVGCAHGKFLNSIQPLLNNPVVGLELNEQAIESGKKNKIDIRLETVQQHAENHKEAYDIVCSFQVLEHIADVRSFLNAKIDCLKTGGMLIISVPNNEAFIKNEAFPLLNLPPHHMGRWTPASLSYLTNIFPLKLKATELEPFQDHHIDYYLKMKVSNLIKSDLLTAVIFKFKLHKLLFSRSKVKKIVSEIDGHSVMVVFEKV